MGLSFMEFWGESVDPGKVGGVDLSAQHEACECRPLVLLRFLFVVIGLPVAWYYAIPQVPLPTWQAAAVVIGGTLVYVALSYLVMPDPDLENLGPCVGMIDHPWRYSDDVNRILLHVQCLLGPGRFVAESVLDIHILFRQDDPEEAELRPEEEWRKYGNGW